MTPTVDPRIWDDLRRVMPEWLPAAKLGIFIHWGPYSVPAWAEPSGALGVVPESEWFKHNAYAEWYFNTIRIPGSPAAQHHHDVYHDAPLGAAVRRSRRVVRGSDHEASRRRGVVGRTRHGYPKHRSPRPAP